VYDLAGRRVAILMKEEELRAGYHEFVFDATGMASGVYFYRLHSGDFRRALKMTVLK
jgi:hypothetical protein